MPKEDCHRGEVIAAITCKLDKEFMERYRNLVSPECGNLLRTTGTWAFKHRTGECDNEIDHDYAWGMNLDLYDMKDQEPNENSPRTRWESTSESSSCHN
jgi:hypothetical protein